MTRVKICGITNISDARATCDAGADAIGLNFYPKSPRFLSNTEAIEIRSQIPYGIQVVGVFVNADPAEILDLCRTFRLDAVQLHGNGTAATVEQLSRTVPVFKAFRVGSDFRVTVLQEFSAATAFLFDAADPAPGEGALQYGGTGHRSNWKVAQEAARRHHIILAGGLNPQNVADAILHVRPYAVDVASGVESSSGAKNHDRVREFIHEVRRADQQLAASREEVRMT